MADQVQRSRSVYIGNLPWDVKDEELKKIFSQVGTIISLRMPADPESGRSRGFAFCEFKEQKSVADAIQHFNAYELNGRKIRVDSAANNPEKDAKAGPAAIEAQFGEPCDPVKAPEIIATAVGKMSPQQVQAVISDAKRCFQADPEEARTALVNNPQLTYALLLALVRGRYITKERGTEALVKPEPPLLPLFPESRPAPVPAYPPMADPRLPPQMNHLGPGPMHVGGGRMPQGLLPVPLPQMPNHFSLSPHQGRPDYARPEHSRATVDHRRQEPYVDNRSRNHYPPLVHSTPTSLATKSPRPASPTSTASAEEKEKAELIMQVLKLREEDIAKMAPEQQRTVRMLRDQFKNISK